MPTRYWASPECSLDWASVQYRTSARKMAEPDSFTERLYCATTSVSTSVHVIAKRSTFSWLAVSIRRRLRRHRSSPPLSRNALKQSHPLSSPPRLTIHGRRRTWLASPGAAHNTFRPRKTILRSRISRSRPAALRQSSREPCSCGISRAACSRPRQLCGPGSALRPARSRSAYASHHRR
jgi:hypothetical protein